jgi:NADPH:quinone reductase
LEAVDVDVASPRAGEVAIAVETISVTFVETQMRSGRPPRPEMLPGLPWIPGNGVGGTVVEVGAGVDPTLLEATVVSTTGGAGGYAARAVVDAAAPIRVPEGLGLDVATALLADGRTATRLAAGAAIKEGERVLVEAAAGGVGSLLVQLARQAGATVVAAAGAERKLAVARDLGAAEVVDYSAPGWEGEVEPVDVVFDGVGGEVGSTAFALLRPGGRHLPFGAAGGAFGPFDREAAAERGVEVVSSHPPSPAENRRLTEAALAASASGSLRPLVGQRLPLAEAAAAHRAIEARGTIGKTLLVP